MRRIIAMMFVVILTLNLCSCREQKSVDEKFMDSLAAGLEARWTLTNEDEDKSTLSKQDWEEYFDAEYNQIAEFKDAEFEDANLGKWAVIYIDSINDSKEALIYFNTNQWNAKYTNGVYHTRVEAIYNINKIAPIPVADEWQDELQSLVINGEVAQMVNKVLDDVKFKKVEDEYGWKKYEAVVENTSNTTFSNFWLTVDLIDEDGVTVDSEIAMVENWDSGEKIKFVFSTDSSFEKMKVTYAEWSF